ncbi:MAG: acyl-CoA thioesterase [Burkholderiales bacterium]|nr:acyl-CoA thioesterase [Burkholderiales bacterium]
MNSLFRAVHPIRFHHCDPGGIVYFPRFFDFIQATVEDWCDQAVEGPFETELLKKRLGLPVLATQCEFFRPSKIGDRLEIDLAVARLGRSTLDLRLRGSAGGEERFQARHLIAMISLESRRSVPLTDALRTRLAPQVLGEPPLARIAHAGSAPKTFRSQFLLRFSHCDPAGILYFTNTFDMINAVAEDWFSQGLGRPFDDLHMRDRLGFPIVDTRCEFLKPSRIGETLTLELTVARLGRASIQLSIAGIVAGEVRMRARHVTALMSLETLQSCPIPPDLRARMAEYTVQAGEGAAQGR